MTNISNWFQKPIETDWLVNRRFFIDQFVFYSHDKSSSILFSCFSLFVICRASFSSLLKSLFKEKQTFSLLSSYEKKPLPQRNVHFSSYLNIFNKHANYSIVHKQRKKNSLFFSSRTFSSIFFFFLSEFNLIR